MNRYPKFELSIAGAIVALLLSACVSAPGGQGGRVSDDSARAATGSRDAAATARRRAAEAVPEQSPDRTDSAPLEAAVGIEAILAERRRADYPEIQADATGFTITEQVRISGATYARYEQALIELRQQRYAEGIRQLEAITAESPELTAPWVELGIAYRTTGDIEAAAEALEFAAELSPGHPIVHNELGIVYRRAGRFAEARAEYEKALAVYADFHFARRNLAVLCDLYLADPECALANYRAYLDSAGEDDEVRIWVADLTSRLGSVE